VDLSKRDWKSAPPCSQAHLDGGFHAVSKDDELRRSASVMGAKWAALGRSPQSTQMSFYFIPSFSCIKRDGNFSVWIFRRALIYDSFGSAIKIIFRSG
jgi:hypothetical protein